MAIENEASAKSLDRKDIIVAIEHARANFWLLIAGLLFVICCAVVGVQIARYYASLSAPEVSIVYPSEDEIQLMFGESSPLVARVTGKVDRIVWRSTCLQVGNEECQKVLKWTEGKTQNLVTAPDRPEEQIIVSIEAKYKENEGRR